MSKFTERAKKYCEKLRHQGNGIIQLKRTPSKLYGYVASALDDEGNKLSQASGAQYDKDAAALSSALRWLHPEGKMERFTDRRIHTIQPILKDNGWHIELVANSQKFMLYQLVSIIEPKKDLIQCRKNAAPDVDSDKMTRVL